jgi:hypothetical protein
VASGSPCGATSRNGRRSRFACLAGNRSKRLRPPPSFNRAWLVKRLAYRIQELAYGGLSVRAETKLKGLIAEEEARLQGKPVPRRGDRPIAGTRLIREWQGVEHAVTVLGEGCECQGRPYKSRSAIARAITGTRWNGPLFFGVRSHRSGT